MVVGAGGGIRGRVHARYVAPRGDGGEPFADDVVGIGCLVTKRVGDGGTVPVGVVGIRPDVAVGIGHRADVPGMGGVAVGVSGLSGLGAQRCRGGQQVPLGVVGVGGDD